MYDYLTALIDSCHKIVSSKKRKRTYGIIYYLTSYAFYNIDSTRSLVIKPELLRAIEDIYLKEVVQYKILDKIVLVNPLLLRTEQVSDLSCEELDSHQRIVRVLLDCCGIDRISAYYIRLFKVKILALHLLLLAAQKNIHAHLGKLIHISR